MLPELNGKDFRGMDRVGVLSLRGRATKLLGVTRSSLWLVLRLRSEVVAAMYLSVLLLSARLPVLSLCPDSESCGRDKELFQGWTRRILLFGTNEMVFGLGKEGVCFGSGPRLGANL